MFINQIGDSTMWFYILAFHWCVIIWVASRLWANIANRDVSFNIPDWTIRSVIFFICRILRDGVGWNHSVYIDFQRGPWNRASLRSPCFTESSMASRFVTSSPSIASWQNNIREIVPVFFIHHSNEYGLRFVVMSWLSVSLKYVKMAFGRLYHIYGMWNAITRGLLMYRKCRTFALEI